MILLFLLAFFSAAAHAAETCTTWSTSLSGCTASPIALSIPLCKSDHLVTWRLATTTAIQSSASCHASFTSALPSGYLPDLTTGDTWTGEIWMQYGGAQIRAALTIDSSGNGVIYRTDDLQDFDNFGGNPFGMAACTVTYGRACTVVGGVCTN